MPGTLHNSHPVDSELLPSGDEVARVESGMFSACDLAKTLAVVRDRPRREGSWFLHAAAMRAGGFSRLAALIPKFCPEAMETPTMRLLESSGPKPYKQADAQRIYQEFYPPALSTLDYEYRPDTSKPTDWPRDRQAALALCAEQISGLGEDIRDTCQLKDSYHRIIGMAATTRSLDDLLAEFRRAWSARAAQQVAETAVTREVFGALDYATTAGAGITLIEGDPRTGKTASTKAWCDANLHRARYLSLETSMTDSAFFAEINRALGNPSPFRDRGTTRLRQHIRTVLDTRDLMLVIDEAQWAWGSARKAASTKVNWMMTALVNRGVSVALVVTPQFMSDLGRFEKDTAWAAAQWKGRIVNFVRLPTSLPDDEVKAVARRIFPEGDATAVRMLARFAQASPSYLHAIRTGATRARYLAKADGQAASTEHVKRAIDEQLALVQDLTQASAPAGRRASGRVHSSPLPPKNSAAESLSQLTAASRLQGDCSGVPEPLADRSRPVLLQT